jgi:hypothetical protein
MRSGVFLSAIGHVALVLAVMLSTPRRLAVMEAPVEVEIVRADEIEQPKDEPKPEKEKPSPWDWPSGDKSAAQSKQSDQPQVTPPTYQDKASKTPDPAASPASNAQSAPSNSQQAALTSQSAPSIAQQPTPGAPKPPASVFDPENIPRLMDIANAPSSGFDSETTVAANISNDDRAAFKAHLRKCWKLAEGAAPATRVVVRVYLKRDGVLASDPVLIEASASRDGPAVYQAALRALKTCQPYGFLPAEKYSEWKILDLSFTPRDMTGG